MTEGPGPRPAQTRRSPRPNPCPVPPARPATPPEPTPPGPTPPGAAPAPRARSSSKANSASETFLPTDFVPYRLILYGAVGSVSTAWESLWEEVAGFACGSPGRTIGGRRRAKGLRLNRFPYSLVGSLPGPSAWRKIVHRTAPEPTTSRLKIATP